MGISELNALSALVKPQVEKSSSKEGEQTEPTVSETPPAAPPEVPPLPVPTDAVVLDINEHAFQKKLEKHLRDYRKGEGHLSADMYRKIGEKNAATGNLLASTDVNAFSLYNQYRSGGFGYEKDARFITAVNKAARTAAHINKVYKDSEE